MTNQSEADRKRFAEEMKQKAQDQIDDSIRMGECIRKEGETRLARKLSKVLDVKKEVLQGKTHKDIHAIFPLFKSQEIELLMKYILEHKDCSEMQLIQQLLKLK